MILIPNNKTSKVLQPCKESFNSPPAAITAKNTSILRGTSGSILSMRCDHLNSLDRQFFIEFIAIVGTITNQSFRFISEKPFIESVLDKGDFMRVSRRCVHGDRKTSAICHCHELRTFAPLGFSHTRAPFLATTKVASIKHSDNLNSPRSSRSLASVSSNCRNVPERTHSWKRRWQVWYGGKRSGRSYHLAPDRSIQRMPLRTSRSDRLGRPFLSSRILGLGRRGSMIAHWASDNSTRRAMMEIYTTVFECTSHF